MPTGCLLILMKTGKKCWATEVGELLCKTGFYYVWLQQGVGDVKSFLYVFKQSLLDMFTQEWTVDIRDKENIRRIDLSTLCLKQKNISY